MARLGEEPRVYMSDTLSELKEEFPQHRLTIERMSYDGHSFEEIEDHLINLSETDED